MSDLEDQLDGEVRGDDAAADGAAQPRSRRAALTDDDDDRQAAAGAESLVDGEAEGSEGSDAADSEIDSSEEEEGEDEFEEDGFVVGSDEEDEEDDAEGSGAVKRKRKKKRKTAALELDEDDYDLLEENQVKVKRPSGHKRLKRVQTGPQADQDAEQMRNELFGQDDLEDELEEVADSDEDMGGEASRRRAKAGGDAAGKGRPSERSQPRSSPGDGMQRRAAGSQRGQPGAGAGRRPGGMGPAGDTMDNGELEDEDDEMGDFIVDEGPGGRERARRRRGGLAGTIPGVSAAALEDAADIFGNLDDLMELYNQKRSEQQADEDGELEVLEDEPGPDEDEDEEVAQRREALKEAKRLKAQNNRLLKVLPADTLAAQYLLPEDQLIKEKDWPERFQLQKLEQVSQPIQDAEKQYLDDCAEWIHQVIFTAKDVDGACMHNVKEIILEGILEVDGSQPAPRPEGWLPNELVHPRDTNAAGRGPIILGNRRAVRAPRSEHERKMWEESAAAQAALRSAIRTSLTLLYEKGEEPAMQGLYRKEQLGELLAMRPEDMPEVTTQVEFIRRQEHFRTHPKHTPSMFPVGTIQAHHRRLRRFDALWAVMQLSLQYKKLVRRRVLLRQRLEAILSAFLTSGDDEENAPDVKADMAELEAAQAHLEKAWSEFQLNDVEARVKLIQDYYGAEQLGLTELTMADGQSQSQGRRAMPHQGPSANRTMLAHRGLRNMRLLQMLRQVVVSPSTLASTLENPELHFTQQPEDPAADVIHGMPKAWVVDWAINMNEAHPDEQPIARLAMAGADQILNKAKQLAAMELAVEPGIRNWLRHFYADYATVSTTPTPSLGRDHVLLEPWAKFGRVRRLADKPLETFRGTDLFLRVHHAERSKLITVTIELPKTRVDEVITTMTQFYTNTDVSAWAKAWNEWRGKVVEEVVKQKLLPLMASETRQRLLAEAKEAALEQYGRAFWRLASRAPMRLQVDKTEEEDLQYDCPRVLAVCWGPGDKMPTVAVSLDERGRLVDKLPCGQLSGSIQRTGTSSTDNALVDARKSKDMRRLLDHVLDKAPNAVVVGASNPACQQLVTDFQAIQERLMDQHAAFLRELEGNRLDIQLVDERLAVLWEDSKAAKEEFAEYSSLERRAIALGRLQQEPLAMLAQLCGDRREILSLQLTELQDVLGEEERMQVVQQLMVTTATQVGLDINLVANVPWHKDLLQFVPGLGPRKAKALMQAITRGGNKVENRNSLYKDMGDVLGKIVFRNCSGSIRVTNARLAHLANMELRILDATRIQAQSYGLALALVDRATGEQDVEAAVEQHQDKIEAVDLMALMVEKGQAGKLATYIDTQLELCAPSGELRPPFKPLDGREVFLLMHGETEQSLCAGRLVETKVVYVGRDEIKIRLMTSGGMEGVIHRDKFSSSLPPHVQLRDVVQRDQVIKARVLAVADDKQQERQPAPSQINREPEQDQTQKPVMLILSSKQDDLDPEPWERLLCHQFDKYFQVMSKQERQEQHAKEMQELRAASGRGRTTPMHGTSPGRTTPSRTTPSRTTPSRDAKAAKPTEHIVERPIKHPRFQNITLKDASMQMAARKAEVGTYIIRPDSQPSGLNLTLLTHTSDKGGLNLFNFKIQEAPAKPGRGLQLSTPLTLRMVHAGGWQDSYEDLDELDQRLVQPLTERFQQVARHRKFVDGSKTVVEEVVRQQFHAAQRMISPYQIGILGEKGGIYCFIAFLSCNSMSGNVRHDYFSPTPDGFYWRGQMYDKLDKLLQAFKAAPVTEERQQQIQNLGYSVPGSMPTSLHAGQAPTNRGLDLGAPGPAGYSQGAPAAQGWQQPHPQHLPPQHAYTQPSYGPPPPQGYGHAHGSHAGYGGPPSQQPGYGHMGAAPGMAGYGSHPVSYGAPPSYPHSQGRGPPPPPVVARGY